MVVSGQLDLPYRGSEVQPTRRRLREVTEHPFGHTPLVEADASPRRFREKDIDPAPSWEECQSLWSCF